MDWFWRAVEYGWLDYLVLLVVGRALLAWLPPGRVGGSGVSELPATLAVSMLLGYAAMAWTVTVGPAVPHESRLWLATPWIALGAARWFLRPHAFVAGHATPVPVDARGRVPAALLLALVSTSPLWWIPNLTRDEPVGRAMASIGLALLVVTIVHALGQARRALAGRVLIAVLLVTTPALRESAFHIPTLPAALVALTCAGLIGWTRRADPRHASLALLGAASTYPYSPTLWIAGFATIVWLSHNRARRTALLWCAGLLVLVIAPQFLFGQPAPVRIGDPSDLPLLEPSFLEAVERRELWGLLWYACAFAVAATLAGVCGGRMSELPLKPGEAERPTREVRALIGFLAGAFVLHAIEHLLPSSVLAAHARPTWLGFLALLAPASALLLGLVFTPGERSASRS